MNPGFMNESHCSSTESGVRFRADVAVVFR